MMQPVGLGGFRRLAAGCAVFAVIVGVIFAGFVAGCGGDSKPTPPPQAPVVQVLAPNGGESYVAGMAVDLAWTATDGDTPAADLRIAIEFSSDGGPTWLPVVNGDPNDGTFGWVVPGTATTQARIRVTATDGVNQGSDISDGLFSIALTPPQPNNTIAAGDATGESGSVAEVSLSLRNQDAAGLIEVCIEFDGIVAEYASGRLTGRGAGMQLTAHPLTADTLKVTIQQQGDVVIGPGDGPIAVLGFRLTGAVGVETNLQLSQARFLDPSGVERSVSTHHGSLTVRMVDTQETLTAAGWAAFEASDLGLALEKFDAAIGIDAEYGAAYTGRGWVRLTRAATAAGFRAAVSSFDEAVARGQTGADVRGGRAAARLALGGDNLVGALEEARAALAVSPDFVFLHRTSFDHLDLHLIAAFAEAGRGGRFTEARQEADSVQVSGIRSADPQTWTVDGTRYPAFESAVLAWLHKMSAAFAG